MRRKSRRQNLPDLQAFTHTRWNTAQIAARSDLILVLANVNEP